MLQQEQTILQRRLQDPTTLQRLLQRLTVNKIVFWIWNEKRKAFSCRHKRSWVINTVRLTTLVLYLECKCSFFLAGRDGYTNFKIYHDRHYWFMFLAAATSTNSHTFISFLAFASPLIADVYYTIRINPKVEQILIPKGKRSYYPANKGEYISFNIAGSFIALWRTINCWCLASLSMMVLFMLWLLLTLLPWW